MDCCEDSGIEWSVEVTSCFKRDIFAVRVLMFAEREDRPRV